MNPWSNKSEGENDIHSDSEAEEELEEVETERVVYMIEADDGSNQFFYLEEDGTPVVLDPEDVDLPEDAPKGISDHLAIMNERSDAILSGIGGLITKTTVGGKLARIVNNDADTDSDPGEGPLRQWGSDKWAKLKSVIIKNKDETNE